MVQNLDDRSGKVTIVCPISLGILKKSYLTQASAYQLTGYLKIELRQTVITDEWGWEHHLYISTYRFLEEVDYAFGGIDRIQNQPRDDWHPWLSRSFNLGYYSSVSRLIVRRMEVNLRLEGDGNITFAGIEEINDMLHSGASPIKMESKQQSIPKEQEENLSVQGRYRSTLNCLSIIFLVEVKSPFP